MKFSHDKIYLILEDFFKPQETRVLLVKDNEECFKVQDFVTKAEYLAKGVELSLCAFIGELKNDEDRSNCDIILNEDGIQYEFQVRGYLGYFPRIEGEFVPGIYSIKGKGQFHEIKAIDELSKIIEDLADTWFEVRKIRFNCNPEGLELFDTAENRAVLNGTIPRLPFNYYDLFCPICSTKVMTYEVYPDESGESGWQCRNLELTCPHYLGMTCNQYDRIDLEELDDLGIIYKFENRQLYVQTKSGWVKPITYEPPHEPLQSYWNRSQEYGFVNTLYFLEKEKEVSKEK